MTDTEHPWNIGPSELIAFALENMHGGSDFNRRLSFLILDIGVETLFKTYLTLPESITKTTLPYGKRRLAADGTFKALVEGIREAIPFDIRELKLDYAMYYHDVRNTLYHQGSTVGTVRVDQLTGYAELAVTLLEKLLGVNLSSLLVPPEIAAEDREGDEIPDKAFQSLLTRIRIPDGQLALYKALYEAGEDGLTPRKLEIATGRSSSVLAGVLGALGNRIKNTRGFENRPDINAVLDITPSMDDGWIYIMRPALRKAIEEEKIFDLYGISIDISTNTSERKASPRNLLYRDFFRELSNTFQEASGIRELPKPQPQNWYSFGAGRSGFAFGWTFRRGNRFSAELYIDASSDAEVNKEYLEILRSKIDPNQPDVKDLEWEKLPNSRACRVVFYRPGDIGQTKNNPNIRKELIDWGIDKMNVLRQLFQQHLTTL